MSVSKEFLMEAAGLTILVALLFVGVQVFQRAVKLTNLLEEGQEQQISELEEYEIIKYDGLRIDGMTAVNYIKRMTGSYAMVVELETTEGSFVITKEDYSELKDSTSKKYVSPLAIYDCEVLRDENRAIAKIKITIERSGD